MQTQVFNPRCLSEFSVAGRDRNQSVRKNSSLSGTGGGEEASLGAGERIPEEESQGERGGRKKGSRRGERKQGEETRFWWSLVHWHKQHSVSTNMKNWATIQWQHQFCRPEVEEVLQSFKSLVKVKVWVSLYLQSAIYVWPLFVRSVILWNIYYLYHSWILHYK